MLLFTGRVRIRGIYADRVAKLLRDHRVPCNRSISLRTDLAVVVECETGLAVSCAQRYDAVSSPQVSTPMATDPTKPTDESTPVITPERAAELVREGEEAARNYRQRVEQMWTISKDARQTRAR